MCARRLLASNPVSPTKSGLFVSRLLLLLAALFALVMACLPQPPQLPGQPSDKLQHIVAFVVLTLLARAAYPAVRPAITFASLAAFGALIEIVQSIPVLHRDASVVDWIVDCLAVATTLGMLMIAKRLIGTGRASTPKLRTMKTRNPTP